MAQSREEKAANKIADIFADERLNVVQLGYHTGLILTPSIMNRLRGWLIWHDQVAESVHLRDDGGTDFIDGEYLKYIKRV
jgi:hypothetical protein